MILYKIRKRTGFLAAIELVIFGIVECPYTDLCGGFGFSDKGTEENVGKRVKPPLLRDHACIDNTGI